MTSPKPVSAVLLDGVLSEGGCCYAAALDRRMDAKLHAPYSSRLSDRVPASRLASWGEVKQPCSNTLVTPYRTKYRHISHTLSPPQCRWFHDTLVDADLAINAYMWQNGGHSGLDQWNFVMHPVFAAKKSDPEGQYVRRCALWQTVYYDRLCITTDCVCVLRQCTLRQTVYYDRLCITTDCVLRQCILRQTVYYDSVYYDSVYYDSVYYDSVHYDSVHYDSVHYDSVHYDSVHYDSVHYDSVHYDSVHYDSVHYDSVHYDSVHYDSVH
jgi:hypothetical protein